MVTQLSSHFFCRYDKKKRIVSRQPNLYLTLNLIPWKTRCKGTAFLNTHQIFAHKNMFYSIFFLFLTSKFDKIARNYTFFYKLFGHFKKKQYLCTRFRKGSKHRIGAVVQLVRIHACHAWGRGFESRPHRKKEMQSASLFCGIRTARAREYALRWSRVRVPSAPQEATFLGCFFFLPHTSIYHTFTGS